MAGASGRGKIDAWPGFGRDEGLAMKDGNVYWSKRALDDDSTTADILAIGDSWFWYPYPGGSLIRHIGTVVAPQGHNILVVGNNGAEAYDYVKGKYKREVRELLRLFGSTASAVLISGGGNDFAGFNDLRPLLRDDCSGAAAAEQCFVAGDDEGSLGWLMQRIFESYALLISRLLVVLPATSPVLVHSYDYAVPDGRGVMGGAGWLKPALVDAKVPPALHQACINLLIEAAHGLLAQLAASAGGRVRLVDCRGTLVPTEWANELHPTPAGFRKLAQTCWKPELVRFGLA